MPPSSRRPASSAPARSARPRAPRPVVTAPRARALRAGVLCALVVLCLVSVLTPLSASVRQQAELSALGDEVDAARARVDDLTARTARWDDPAYVSAQARDRLHYVLPGETGYRVLDAPAGWSAPRDEAAAAGGLAAGEQGPAAWYAELWGSVETAGLP